MFLLGGRSAAGGPEAGGERAPAAGHHQRCGEGAGSTHTGIRNEQTQGTYRTYSFRLPDHKYYVKKSSK